MTTSKNGKAKKNNRYRAKPTAKATKNTIQSEPSIVANLTKLSFFAMLEETKMRQSATTLDNSYTIKVKTHDSNIMDLGKLPPLTLLKVTIEVIDEADRMKASKHKDKLYE